MYVLTLQYIGTKQHKAKQEAGIHGKVSCLNRVILKCLPETIENEAPTQESDTCKRVSDTGKNIDKGQGRSLTYMRK